uniref:Putative secreted protein n=1 Tax=Xenopsylla cheopis TaxID=163159 RepID=A0A6M2DXD8_XENCH
MYYPYGYFYLFRILFVDVLCVCVGCVVSMWFNGGSTKTTTYCGRQKLPSSVYVFVSCAYVKDVSSPL